MKPQSPQPTVRKAHRADIEALTAFNCMMARETESRQLDVDVVRSGVAAVFDDAARGFYVIAEVRGEVVASLLITFEWSDWRNQNFWWIQSVYVARDWRRRGLYRMLYDEVCKRADACGNVCGFRLYVERDNRIAQQTYRALGMHQTRYEMYEQSR